MIHSTWYLMRFEIVTTSLFHEPFPYLLSRSARGLRVTSGQMLILGVRSINQSTQIYARAGSSTASRSWKSGFLSLVQRGHNIIHWTFQIRPERAAFEVKELCIPTKKEYLLWALWKEELHKEKSHIAAKHRSIVDNEGEFITLSKIEDSDYEDQESADESESSSESIDSDSESEETASFESDETTSESDESSSDWKSRIRVFELNFRP